MKNYRVYVWTLRTHAALMHLNQRTVWCHSDNASRPYPQDANESTCSFLRPLSTWHSPHLLLSAELKVSFCSAAAARTALSSKPAARHRCSWMTGQTDGRTDTRPLQRPCSTYHARSANNRSRRPIKFAICSCASLRQQHCKSLGCFLWWSYNHLMPILRLWLLSHTRWAKNGATDSWP